MDAKSVISSINWGGYKHKYSFINLSWKYFHFFIFIFLIIPIIHKLSLPFILLLQTEAFPFPSLSFYSSIHAYSKINTFTFSDKWHIIKIDIVTERNESFSHHHHHYVNLISTSLLYTRNDGVLTSLDCMDGKNRESFSRCRIRIKKLLIRKFMMGRDRYNFDKLRISCWGVVKNLRVVGVIDWKINGLVFNVGGSFWVESCAWCRFE